MPLCRESIDGHSPRQQICPDNPSALMRLRIVEQVGIARTLGKQTVLLGGSAEFLATYRLQIAKRMRRLGTSQVRSSECVVLNR